MRVGYAGHVRDETSNIAIKVDIPEEFKVELKDGNFRNV